MNLKEIKSIIENDMMNDESKRWSILRVISFDEKAIPDIMEMLNEERKRKKELLGNINLLLSKAHVGLETARYEKGALNADGFIQREIMQFYIDNKDNVGHCFKNMDKIQEPASDQKAKTLNPT